MSSGGARFGYHGLTTSIYTSGNIRLIRSGSTATAVIRDRAFNNFVNFEGSCAGIFHYLFLYKGEQCMYYEQMLNTVTRTYHEVLGIPLVYIQC